MALFRKRFREVPYKDNNIEDIDLRTVRKLRTIVLLFVGTLVISGGTTDGTLVEDGVLKTLFKKLELIGNGKTFYDTVGVSEYFRRAIMTGSAGVLVPPADASVGSHPIKAYVALDLDQVQAGFNIAKFAGRLNVDLLDSLNLRIESGEADGGIVTGGDRPETVNGTYEVVAVHSEKGWRGGHRQVSRHRVEITGSSDDTRITLPSGILVSNILLRAVRNDLRDNTFIERVKVQIGEDDIRRDISWEELQGENVEEFGLETVGGAPPYDGLAVANFNVDGDMDPKALLDLRGLKDRSARIVLENGSPSGSVNFVEATVSGVRARPIPA